ncbi:hypothetical protein [Helicobacter suis]|nr:hypothetical protein [Helicobacter suis]
MIFITPFIWSTTGGKRPTKELIITVSLQLKRLSSPHSYERYYQ